MTAAIPLKNTAWWRYKFRAMLISFSISVLFISILTGVLLHWLYPEWFLFRYDGGWQGLKIVLGVELILGSVIAFVIFSPNKARHLILFDSAIVGTIQLSAFIWGCYALWSQHPLALIYRDDSFHSLKMADLQAQQADLTVLSPFANRRPILIYSQPPQGEGAVAEVIEMFTMNIAPFSRIENYQPIEQHLDEVFAHDAIRKQALEKVRPGALESFAKKHDQNLNDLRLVPITMRSEFTAVIVMNKNADIIGAIPVSNNFDTVMAMVRGRNKK